MPTIRYVGPIDTVRVPLIGREVSHGDELEVTDDEARRLLEQPDNFAPVGDALDAMTVAELKHVADQKDVDLSGLTKKADIVAAIKKG